MKTVQKVALLMVTLLLSNLSCKKADPSSFDSGRFPAPMTSNTAKPQPTALDKWQVKSEVLAVLRQYFDAVVRADKAGMERTLADDFIAKYQNTYDKESSIRAALQHDPNVIYQHIGKPELVNATADTATIHYDFKLEYKDQWPGSTHRESADFVKRDGRWQIKAMMAAPSGGR
jgi:hypothetical protein